MIPTTKTQATEEGFNNNMNPKKLILVKEDLVVRIFVGFWLYDGLKLTSSNNFNKQTTALNKDFDFTGWNNIKRYFRYFKDHPLFTRVESRWNELKKLKESIKDNLKPYQKITKRKENFFQLFDKSEQTRLLFGLFEKVCNFTNPIYHIRVKIHEPNSGLTKKLKVKDLERFKEILRKANINLALADYQEMLSPFHQKIIAQILEISKDFSNGNLDKFEKFFEGLNSNFREFLVESSDGLFEKGIKLSDLSKEDWEDKAFSLVVKNNILKNQLEKTIQMQNNLAGMIFELNWMLDSTKKEKKQESWIQGEQEKDLEGFMGGSEEVPTIDLEGKKNMLITLKGDTVLKMLKEPMLTPEGYRKLNITIPITVDWKKADSELSRSEDPSETLTTLETEYGIKIAKSKQLIADYVDSMNKEKERNLRSDKPTYLEMSQKIKTVNPISGQMSIFGQINLLGEADFVYQADPQEIVCSLCYNKLRRRSENKYFIATLSFFENQLICAVKLSPSDLQEELENNLEKVGDRIVCLKTSQRGIAVLNNYVFQVLIADSFEEISIFSQEALHLDLTSHEFLAQCILLRNHPLNLRRMKFEPNRCYIIQSKKSIEKIVREKVAFELHFWKTEHTLQDFDGLPLLYFVPSDDKRRWNEDFYIDCLKKFDGEVAVKKIIFWAEKRLRFDNGRGRQEDDQDFTDKKCFLRLVVAGSKDH